MRSILPYVLLAIFLLLACGQPPSTEPQAEKAPVKADEMVAEAAAPSDATMDINVDSQGRALGGFDVVSYHEYETATPGKDTFSTRWSGATWLFTSAANLEKFKADPQKYAPSNGGYCTFGIILEKKLDGNPEVWHMKDEQLYIFLNQEVKDKFLQDEAGNLARVAENWPKVAGH